MIDTKYPYLKLSRLVIYSQSGKEAYDEKFHDGLNIIRGENSSGKSTIANFIFFVLGGDFNNWTAEALLCTDVYAETIINDITITLHRKVSDKSQQPLSIFYGPYEQGINKKSEGWKTYPYRHTESLTSFSSVLFDILKYPETRADSDNKITIHQILRLIYIDQDSPIQSLFRFERFDVSLIRQAISELLLGIYDDSLYHDRVAIRTFKKEYEEKTKLLNSIKSAFKVSGNLISKADIEKSIVQAEEKLENIDMQIRETYEKTIIKKKANSKSNLELIQNELRKLQKDVNIINETVNRLNDDIIDSSFFIETLKKREKAIEDSIFTRKIFGTLPIYHCPQCLSTIKAPETDENCSLCKEPLSVEDNKSHAFRIKQELELQIKESSDLLKNKVEKHEKESSNLSALIGRMRLKQRELDNAISEASSNRDQLLDNLFKDRGAIEYIISALIEQRKTAEYLDTLLNESLAINHQIEKLRSQIRDKEGAQETKFESAQLTISKIAKFILSKDLDRQAEFKHAKAVTIDYLDDVFSVDGKFNFSASSNTYLKNAVRFSIFFASLLDSNFRYPRFILCDNVEDKGMEEARSKNFQTVISELSKQMTSRHQIIITTSMIDESLNKDSNVCVGDFYTHKNRSLKI
jgi:DNA repair exonuclease SbcCD ATPase subunit